MALLSILLRPFGGSLFAAFLPSNARNAEAWLAGAIALVGLVLTCLAYPSVSDGGVIRGELRVR